MSVYTRLCSIVFLQARRSDRLLSEHPRTGAVRDMSSWIADIAKHAVQ